MPFFLNCKMKWSALEKRACNSPWHPTSRRSWAIIPTRVSKVIFIYLFFLSIGNECRKWGAVTSMLKALFKKHLTLRSCSQETFWTETFSEAVVNREGYHNIIHYYLSCIKLLAFWHLKFKSKFENNDESAFCICLLVEGNGCQFLLVTISSRGFMETQIVSENTSRTKVIFFSSDCCETGSFQILQVSQELTEIYTSAMRNFDTIPKRLKSLYFYALPFS